MLEKNIKTNAKDNEKCTFAETNGRQFEMELKRLIYSLFAKRTKE